MSAVTEHLPKVEYFDWSEFADFHECHKAQAIRLLREAISHVERLTLRQSVAEAAQAHDVTDASVWAAYYALWCQIRDIPPHSERQLMQVIGQWESDQGWVARASRELIQSAMDAYHTSRIDRAASLVRLRRPPDPVPPGLLVHRELGQQVAIGKMTLLDASLEAEEREAGT